MHSLKITWLTISLKFTFFFTAVLQLLYNLQKLLVLAHFTDKIYPSTWKLNVTISLEAWKLKLERVKNLDANLSSFFLSLLSIAISLYRFELCDYFLRSTLYLLVSCHSCVHIQRESRRSILRNYLQAVQISHSRIAMTIVLCYPQKQWHALILKILLFSCLQLI